MIKNDFVAWSSDDAIRSKASSGGIGSTLVKYLFAAKQISAALSFEYDGKTLQYKPRFVRNYDSYCITGSIYQEMEDIYSFYRNYLRKEIVGDGRVLVFALPCQARAIRAIAERQNIKVFIVGLVCSSQQTLDATKYLLKRINVKQSDVIHLQYRGNGWPSGIQIVLKDGSERFVPNNGSVWTQIFHSRLFIPRRCFACDDTLNRFSDLVIADPWRPAYVDKEKTGKTFVRLNTGLGIKIFNELKANKSIIAEELSDGEFDLAQQMTIDRKSSYRYGLIATRRMMKLFANPIYRFFLFINPKIFSFHLRLKDKIENRLDIKMRIGKLQ